eukprot:jgi/Mesen1/845/ME000112S10992
MCERQVSSDSTMKRLLWPPSHVALYLLLATTCCARLPEHVWPAAGSSPVSGHSLASPAFTIESPSRDPPSSTLPGTPPRLSLEHGEGTLTRVTHSLTRNGNNNHGESTDSITLGSQVLPLPSRRRLTGVDERIESVMARMLHVQDLVVQLLASNTAGTFCQLALQTELANMAEAENSILDADAGVSHRYLVAAQSVHDICLTSLAGSAGEALAADIGASYVRAVASVKAEKPALIAAEGPSYAAATEVAVKMPPSAASAQPQLLSSVTLIRSTSSGAPAEGSRRGGIYRATAGAVAAAASIVGQEASRIGSPSSTPAAPPSPPRTSERASSRPPPLP